MRNEMKSTDVFESKYLKAADISGHEPTVVMDKVEMESIQEGEPQRPVLYFKGKKKGMVLNRTNWNTIAYLYGDESDEWPGEKITLFEAMVDFKGTTTPALRIKRPINKTAPKPKARSKGEVVESEDPAEGIDYAAELNDELPGDWASDD
jgi:hypothetical protein